jgi:nucleoside-diphosphate-sugar epimerase
MTVYCIHKQVAENYLKFYAQEHGVRGVTLRLANVYGPGPRSSSSDRGVLNMMIRKALDGETLTIYGEGEHVRDYVYIGDVLNAFLQAGACAAKLSGGHYLIGSEQGHALKEAIYLVAERVEEQLGARPAVTHVPPPTHLLVVEERNFIADTTRFRRMTGWQASVNLKEGIDYTIDAFLRSE